MIKKKAIDYEGHDIDDEENPEDEYDSEKYQYGDDEVDEE